MRCYKPRRDRCLVGFDIDVLTRSVNEFVCKKYGSYGTTRRQIEEFAKNFAHSLNSFITLPITPMEGAYCYSNNIRTTNKCTLSKLFLFRVFVRCSKHLAENCASASRMAHPRAYKLSEGAEQILEIYHRRMCGKTMSDTRKESMRKNISYDFLGIKEFKERKRTHTFIKVGKSRFNAFVESANKMTFMKNIEKNSHPFYTGESQKYNSAEFQHIEKINKVKDVSHNSFNIIDYSKISAFLKAVKFFDGKYYHIQLDEIRESDGFRDYNEGIYYNNRSYNVIANMPKTLRKILFKDMYECDIDSSIFSTMFNVIYHDYHTNTIKSNYLELMKIDYPILYKMMTNKKLFRCKYSSMCGISIESFKQMCTSLTYDSRYNYKQLICDNYKKNIKRSPKESIKSIEKLVAEIEKLSTEFRNYISDEDNANVMIGDIRIGDIHRNAEEELINMRKKKPQNFGRGKKIAPKMTYLYYVQFEHSIRNAMMTLFKTCVQIHDCVIFHSSNITNNISKKIQNMCGLKVPFSLEQFT